MSWTVGRRIGYSFGLLITFMTVGSGIAIYGISGVVREGSELVSTNDLDRNLAQREVDHLNWAMKLSSALIDPSATELKVETDDHKCKFGEWLYGEGRKSAASRNPAIASMLTAIEKPHADLHGSAVALGEALKKKDRAAINQLFASRTKPALEEVRGKLTEIRKIAREASVSDTGMVSHANKAKTALLVLAGLGILVGIAVAVYVGGGIGRQLGEVSIGLSGNAEAMAACARQLSDTSQSLASESTEQAASLEETTAALEEIAAMARQNADNASQAKSLSGNAGMSVDKANASMASMVSAMAEISAKGEETGKIVKTIDEIAFQTNLLALNAAVEAARAGEAGAGFAVVADEVRNLAQRAAGAAKNTSSLIEETIRKINEGTALVEKTNADFGDVAGAVKKVTGLVGEIASASSEQLQGINQVSGAAAAMDKATQQIAASAEESAAGAEDVNSQAEGLRDAVGRLALMVGRQAGAEAPAARAGADAPPPGSPAAVGAKAGPRGNGRGNGKTEGLPAARNPSLEDATPAGRA